MSAVNPDHWAGCDCSQCLFDMATASYKTGSPAKRDASPPVGGATREPTDDSPNSLGPELAALRERGNVRVNDPRTRAEAGGPICADCGHRMVNAIRPVGYVECMNSSCPKYGVSVEPRSPVEAGAPGSAMQGHEQPEERTEKSGLRPLSTASTEDAREATEVPTDLIHEADGLLSLVAHRYRVHDIPRDLCDALIACSTRLRRIGEARKLAAAIDTYHGPDL